MKTRFSTHPNHDQLRVYVSSGQINGRPVPVPVLYGRTELIPNDADGRKTPDFKRKISAIVKAAWQRRKAAG